jgi:type IX secretion system PorP/SprF family membrane protein
MTHDYSKNQDYSPGVPAKPSLGSAARYALGPALPLRSGLAPTAAQRSRQYRRSRLIRIVMMSYLLITGLGGLRLAAQQYPLFSNYWTQAYGFNPAVTASTEGVVINAQYRHQWVGIDDAPITKIGAVQARVGRFGLGGYFFQDQAGALQRTGGTFLAAYRQQLGTQVHLSAGLAGGYHHLRLRAGTQVFDAEDPLVAMAMDGSWFPDFNAGIHLQAGHFFLGFSVPQLFQRRIRFGDGQTRTQLQRHYYLATGYSFRLGEEVQLQPSVLVKLAEGGDPQYEASLRGIFVERFWVGGSYRWQESAVALAGIQLNPRVEFTYAYDFTTSGLRQVSRGSHEVGLTIRLGAGAVADTDGDGTPDSRDRCPQETGPRNNDGCPFDMFTDKSPALDAEDDDGDGIWNSLDECPEVAGPYENKGCPWVDRDFDGIRDEIDECPGLAGVASNNGCPIDDRDRDGIVDQFDECPDAPGTFLSRGCPDSDYDHDGVVNAVDACPNTYGPASNEGCPIVSQQELEVLQVAMRNLYFESNKYTIYFKAYPHLENLALLMQERADWQLRIAGHTDSKGSPEANLEVSRRRAEAVMFYLINQGVRRDQIILEYFGETRPFADNETEASRQLNRRVELEFIFD